MREGDTRAFLVDIVEAARRAKVYTEGLLYDEFLQDLKTQDAVIRNLEVLGEAVKHVPEEVRVQAPDIPWKGFAGMRDKLIHHYFGVNLDVVWTVVHEDLPPLVDAVNGLLSDRFEDEAKETGGSSPPTSTVA